MNAILLDSLDLVRHDVAIRGEETGTIDADKAGGVIVTGPTPAARRATADEVKTMLGK